MIRGAGRTIDQSVEKRNKPINFSITGDALFSFFLFFFPFFLSFFFHFWHPVTPFLSWQTLNLLAASSRSPCNCHWKEEKFISVATSIYFFLYFILLLLLLFLLLYFLLEHITLGSYSLFFWQERKKMYNCAKPMSLRKKKINFLPVHNSKKAR